MKSIILALICTISLLGAGLHHISSVHAARIVRPRFEFIYQERVVGNGYDAIFNVYHDRETGEEIECIHDKDALAPNSPSNGSCFQTSRSW